MGVKKYKLQEQMSLQFGLYGDLPTSTAHQSRLQLYQWTRRPIDIVRNIETSWGSGTVDGKIGQGHADVMESILAKCYSYQITETGLMQVLVDPYKVRVSAGGEIPLGGAQLDNQITDLMKVVIDIRINKTDTRIKGHMIDKVAESTMKAKTRTLTSFGGDERKMWCVDIPADFVRIFFADHGLYYDPAPIAMLHTGIAQAVARHIATHGKQPNGGWILDKLITAVGAGETSVDMRNRRREIQKDALGLLNLGLKIEDGRVKRTKGRDLDDDAEHGV
jgi:hypothetical protein